MYSFHMRDDKGDIKNTKVKMKIEAKVKVDKKYKIW